MSNTFLLKQFSKNPWVMIGGAVTASPAQQNPADPSLTGSPSQDPAPAALTEAQLTQAAPIEATELDQAKSQLKEELDGNDMVDEEPIDNSYFLNRRLGLGDQEEEKAFLKHLENTTGVGQDFSVDETGVDGKPLEGPDIKSTDDMEIEKKKDLKDTDEIQLDNDPH